MEKVCPVPNNAPLLNDIALSKGQHVKKTIFEGPRLIFLAGLEGTGHHLYTDNFDLASTGHDQDVIDLFDTRKTNCGPTGSLAEDCGPALDSDDFIAKRESLVQKLKALHSQGSSKVYGLFHRRPGTEPQVATFPYSYPYARDAGRAILSHPDVRVLAEVAETAEIDFRVVLLTRNARDMLHSTVVHRGFCPGPSGIERQANYLIHNANVLSAQLSKMDKEFVVCAPFEQLPHLSEDLAELYDAALGQPSGYTQQIVNEIYKESTSKLSFTAAEEEIVKKVQQSSNGIFIEGQCSA
jgi:hypothetical protein